jgi:hypothetical protein
LYSGTKRRVLLRNIPTYTKEIIVHGQYIKYFYCYVNGEMYMIDIIRIKLEKYLEEMRLLNYEIELLPIVLT